MESLAIATVSVLGFILVGFGLYVYARVIARAYFKTKKEFNGEH